MIPIKLTVYLYPTLRDINIADLHSAEKAHRSEQGVIEFFV